MSPDEKWARRVVAEVCLDYGIREPEFVWRESRTKPYASGHCYWGWETRIVITAGCPTLPMIPHYKGLTTSVDNRTTVCHELAHLITRRGHASNRFWEVDWELIRKYRLPIGQSKIREGRKGGGRRAYLASR